MNRQSVSSSNLSSVGYDAASRILEIAFLNGSVYHYFGVPLGVYQQLMSAGSKGGYLAAHVKGVYNCSRVG